MSNDSECGLFLACFEIGSGKLGEISFNVHLSVYPPENTVTGAGHIFQATKPPVNITTTLIGNYTSLLVMGAPSQTLVMAKGYPIIKWSSKDGIGPEQLPNVGLTMILTTDWKSGVANYSYKDSEGVWHEINNAPVRLIECNQDSVTNMGA